ncbi:MAG TPA: peptidoglycan DD-metalloendopeptidase family protein [Acidimicrobiia bacterium]|nr:peptidoglycan DD-metalloendopeptidase family protein [Acidimicrobiia bacterium]
MPIPRRGLVLGVLLALFGMIAAPPAWSGSEEEVERARDEEEAAARRRAEALADLDEAVRAFEALRADLESTRTRLGRIDATLADYEVQRERIRSDALDQAAEAYIASFDHQPTTPSPDDAQEVLATRYVLERVTTSNQSALNRLIAVRAEIEALQSDLIAEGERLAGLETEMSAVVERMDALLAEAQAEYDAARQARDTAETRFEAEQARARIFLCPVDGPVAFSDTWGAPRSGGRRHTGQDLIARTGTPLVAVKDGWIKWPSYNSIAGYVVRLRTSDGTEYSYAHMNAPTMWSEGDWVQQGTVIGHVGDSGNAFVPHLHISMWPNGGWTGPTNPYSLLDAACR